MIFFYQTALSLLGSQEGVGAYEHLEVWFPVQEYLGCVQEVQPEHLLTFTTVPAVQVWNIKLQFFFLLINVAFILIKNQ